MFLRGSTSPEETSPERIETTWQIELVLNQFPKLKGRPWSAVLVHTMGHSDSAATCISL